MSELINNTIETPVNPAPVSDVISTIDTLSNAPVVPTYEPIQSPIVIEHEAKLGGAEKALLGVAGLGIIGLVAWAGFGTYKLVKHIQKKNADKQSKEIVDDIDETEETE